MSAAGMGDCGDHSVRFGSGDIGGQPMLAHKAVHEAHLAAGVSAGELQGNMELAAAAFNARVIPSVAWTDPEVAWAGLTEDSGLAPKASRHLVKNQSRT